MTLEISRLFGIFLPRRYLKTIINCDPLSFNNCYAKFINTLGTILYSKRAHSFISHQKHNHSLFGNCVSLLITIIANKITATHFSICTNDRRSLCELLSSLTLFLFGTRENDRFGGRYPRFWVNLVGLRLSFTYSGGTIQSSCRWNSPNTPRFVILSTTYVCRWKGMCAAR